MNFSKIQTINYDSFDAADKFTQSLKETGFAVLINHPIDMQIVKDVYEEWKIFFHSDKKHEYRFHVEKQDGYFPFGLEHAKDYNHRDLKEFFHIYPWGRYPNTISIKTKTLYNDLCKLAGELLKWVEENIPSDIIKKLSIPLEEMIDGSPTNLLRVIHYPPLRDTDELEEVRAAAHEDINLLTVLCSATAPGLQAKDIDGEWHDVPCDPDVIIVNSGDMLQMATDGYFPSTTHRVINPTDDLRTASRLSLPLFLHPHDHVKLSKEHTAKSYLNERLENIGLL